MTDDFAGVDIAGLDNEGLENDGLDNGGLDIDGLDIAGRINSTLYRAQVNARRYYETRQS